MEVYYISCGLSSQFNYHMKEQIIHFDSIKCYVLFSLWIALEIQLDILEYKISYCMTNNQFPLQFQRLFLFGYFFSFCYFFFHIF